MDTYDVKQVAHLLGDGVVELKIVRRLDQVGAVLLDAEQGIGVSFCDPTVFLEAMMGKVSCAGRGSS